MYNSFGVKPSFALLGLILIMYVDVLTTSNHKNVGVLFPIAKHLTCYGIIWFVCFAISFFMKGVCQYQLLFDPMMFTKCIEIFWQVFTSPIHLESSDLLVNDNLNQIFEDFKFGKNFFFFVFFQKIQVLFLIPSIKVTKYDEQVCGNGPQMSKWISAFYTMAHVWLFFSFSSLVYLSTKHPSQTC